MPLDDGGPDSALHDGGGVVDAGRTDAGTTDAGTTDAGTIDAGTNDAGAADGGGPRDAGSAAACALALSCPAPTAGRVSVCGRILDVATSDAITGAGATGIECGSPGATSEGPCALSLAFYELLDFAGDPTGTAPLARETLVVDDCGRFSAHDIELPAFGFLAVALDDGATGDVYRLTSAALPVRAGQIIADHEAFVVTRSSDMAWSGSAGLAGSSFVDRGAVFALYRHGLVPMPGVQVTASGAARLADDFYFSDSDATSRTTVAPAEAMTGASGAALMLGSAVEQHSGRGGEVADCQWPSILAASIPGVLLTTVFTLRTSAGEECP